MNLTDVEKDIIRVWIQGALRQYREEFDKARREADKGNLYKKNMTKLYVMIRTLERELYTLTDAETLP